MVYLESPQNDAYWNMALEEYVFESLPRDREYFLLWQNRNAVVVGKFQNTVEEIDADYVREHGVQVVRRLSGGGAMYQDLGNLNFTFIVDQKESELLDFSVFIDPVVRALGEIGVTAERSGRNDILIGGKKISGNSQYNRKGRTMHHGTLLYDSDLDVIQNALRVKAGKIESKGIKSVRSRVTNIVDHMPQPVPLRQFREILLAQMFGDGLRRRELTDEDHRAIETLREEKYATWEWNYGKSPAYNRQKERRYAFGGVALRMEVERGCVRALHISGDFFGNGDLSELADPILGSPLREDALEQVVASLDVEHYIRGMTRQDFVRLLLDD